VLDRSQVDWGKEIFKLTSRRGVDVVVDNVGKATITKSMQAVARGGRIVIVGNTSGPQALGLNEIGGSGTRRAAIAPTALFLSEKSLQNKKFIEYRGEYVKVFLNTCSQGWSNQLNPRAGLSHSFAYQLKSPNFIESLESHAKTPRRKEIYKS